MRRIVSFFVDNPLIVNVIIVTLMIVGVIVGASIKKESYPDVTFNIVRIATASNGASLRDVELLITKPIEEQLREVSGIEKFESYTRAGNSFINVWLNVWGEEKYKTLQEIREATSLAARQFPEDTDPSIIREIRANDAPVIRYLIHSSSLSDVEVHDLIKDLKETLEGVVGVSQVVLSGYREREIQINFNNQKMLRNNVSIIDLSRAVSNYVVRESAGNLIGPNINRNIQILTDFEKAEDISDINIRRSFTSRGVNVNDIATVVDGLADQDLYVRGNLEPGVTVSIYKEDKQDNFRVLARIQRVVREFDRVIKMRYNKTPPEQRLLLDAVQSSPLSIGFGDALATKISGYYGYAVQIQPFKDATQETRNLLRITQNNAYLGFLFVFITLWVFLEFRIAFWTAFSIPLVIVLTLVVVFFLGYSINNILLFGMITVIGILVDDGIIVAENIYRLRSLGYSPREASIEGVMQLIAPLAATVITTVFAFLPLIIVKKIDFLFIRQMPLVIIITLLMSLVEVFLSLPTHLAHGKAGKVNLLQMKRDRWGNRFMLKIKNGYLAILRPCMKLRYLLVLGFLFLIMFSASLFEKVQFIYYPNDENDEITLRLTAVDGTNLEEMNEKVTMVERVIIEEFGPPGGVLQAIFTTVGSGNLTPTDSNASRANEANIRLLLSSFSERRGMTASDMVRRLERKLKNRGEFHNWMNFPHIRNSNMVQNFLKDPSYGKFVDIYKIFSQFLSPASEVKLGYKEWLVDYRKRPFSVTNIEPYRIFRDEVQDYIRMNSGFTGLNISEPRFGPRRSNPIEVIITGNDDEIRNKAMGEMYNFLASINGVFGIQQQRNDEGKNFFLNMDVRKMEQLGVTASDVASSVRTAFLGTQVGTVSATDNSIDIRVILTKNSRGRITDLENIPIPTKYNTVIPLKSVSRLEMHHDFSRVMRVNGRRASSLMADVDAKQVDTRRVGKMLDQYVPELIVKYPGIGIEQKGELGDAQETERDAALLFLMGLLGIFFTLLFIFRSLSQPIFVLSVLPFGAIGVVISFVLHNQPMTFFGIVGMIGLMGIIINDAIVMVDYINRLVNEKDRKISFIEAVCQGSAGRIRAILLTTITTVAGLLPAVYGWGGGVSILRPLAMALVYGSIFGTLITLFLVPSFYTIDRDIKNALGSSKRFVLGFFRKKRKRVIKNHE